MTGPPEIASWTGSLDLRNRPKGQAEIIYHLAETPLLELEPPTSQLPLLSPASPTCVLPMTPSHTLRPLLTSKSSIFFSPLDFSVLYLTISPSAPKQPGSRLHSWSCPSPSNLTPVSRPLCPLRSQQLLLWLSVPILVWDSTRRVQRQAEVRG